MHNQSSKQFIYLSIYLSLCLSIYLSIYVCMYLSIYVCMYLSIYLSIYLWLYSPFVGPRPFFSFLILYVVGMSSWMGNQPIARPLPAQRTTQAQNKRTQTTMPVVGFEPTILAFEWAKIVHVLDHPATVIDKSRNIFNFVIFYAVRT
jgi:hypothetical protein